MISKKTVLLVAVIAVLTLIAALCGAAPPPETITVIETVVVTQEVEGEVVTVVETVEVVKEVVTTVEVEVPGEMPAGDMEDKVTLHWNIGTEPPSLDPSLATDTSSVDHIANLFVGLTQFDPVTAEVIPYLAKDWTVSEDGLEWTFNLRDDIAWVHYDPITGETKQEMDDEGNPRFVNANDVVYGVKRTIAPETASDYSYVMYIIKNAQEVNGGEDADGNPTELTLDDLGVEAVDDLTVKFTLEQPAGYFPA
jgi:oligopeptide transport system substrate-binding protein